MMSSDDSDTDKITLPNVLLDAAGYLCKLGTNLRLRAERIQVKKMKNTHSVRKVTDKVLLICDLSKKSIDKVEDVVKNAVRNNARHERRISKKSEKRYVYSGKVEKNVMRKIGKIRLSMPEKVNLKHFMSCEVKLHALTITELKKYPSYLHTKPIGIDIEFKENSNKEDVPQKSTLCMNFAKLSSENEKFFTETIDKNTCNNSMSNLNTEKKTLLCSKSKTDSKTNTENLSEGISVNSTTPTENTANDMNKVSDKLIGTENTDKHSLDNILSSSDSELDHMNKLKSKISNRRIILESDNDIDSNEDSQKEKMECSSNFRSKIKKTKPRKNQIITDSDSGSKSNNESSERTFVSVANETEQVAIKKQNRNFCTENIEFKQSCENPNSPINSPKINVSYSMSSDIGNKLESLIVLSNNENEKDSIEESMQTFEKQCLENTNASSTDASVPKISDIGNGLENSISQSNNYKQDRSEESIPKIETKCAENTNASSTDASSTNTSIPKISDVGNELESSISQSNKNKQYRSEKSTPTIKNHNQSTKCKQKTTLTLSEKSLKIKGELINSSDSENDSSEIKKKKKGDKHCDMKSTKFDCESESVSKEIATESVNNDKDKISEGNMELCSKNDYDKSNNTQVDVNNESNKPIIKCIDLNKLLKSPFKEKSSPLLPENSSGRTDTIHSCRINENIGMKPKSKLHSHVSKNIKTDETGSIKGPSKVAPKPNLKELLHSFVPKLFTIKINTLPPFTDQFLERHNLTKITKAGTTIAQLREKTWPNNSSAKNYLLNESSDSSGCSQKKKQCTDNKSKRKHIMKVKRLLTHSSSSDENDADNDLKQKKTLTKAELRKKTEENKRKLLASSSSSFSDSDDDPKLFMNKNSDKNEKLKSLDITGENNNRTKELEETENMKNRSLEDENKNKAEILNETESRKNSSLENEELDRTLLIKRGSRELSKASSISQVDGNNDSMSGSEKEMGRTTRSKTSEVASSENDDRAIDGLVNLKNLQKKNKSRDSPSLDKKGSKKSKGDSSKAKLLDEDDVLLEVESKSSESDHTQGGESIPEDHNGGGVSELAREDLLRDEDSTSEQSNENSEKNGDAKEDIKKKGRKVKPGKVIEITSSGDESEEPETVRSRRKKHKIVSSDSEKEKHKRKTAEKDSDYDEGAADSDDSASQFKSSKRKGKTTDSDSAKSSDSTSKAKKKRRRIKQVKDSDASGSDSENDGKKHGRKNIRRVMGKDQLEEATKKAAREERERIARISERQKLYNSTAFDESGKPDEIKLDKVVLDFDPDTKEPLIQVDPGIVKKLKPHQANGIKFMWDACFESVKQIKKSRGSGCILAHCMGLGKTLQVVSLTHTLLKHKDLTGVHRVLVVCPLSTVLNWVNEYRMWISHSEEENDIDIYELSRYKQNSERSYQLKEWMETGGICVLGYEMFRNLSADNPKKFRKKMLGIFQESLVNPGPDLIICDEGHLLKNEKTSLSQSMNRVKTLRRIVLTGTPLQNNLKEYYCMVQFVKPNLLGKYNEYLNRFVNPITNGQYTNSTEQDIRVMKRRSHVLHKMLDGAVQRRDYGVLAPFLPPKHEYVLFISLTEIQTKLYQHYLDNYSRRQAQAGRSSGFLFPDFQALQRIWTHPRVLKANSERYEIAQQKKRDREQEDDSEGSLAEFINDDSTPEETSEEEEDSDISEGSDDSRKKTKKKKNDKKVTTSARSTRANPGEVAEMDSNIKEPGEQREENPTEWWIPHVEESELEDMRHSNKLMLLFDILRQCEAIGDKLLVFSQSLYSLDLIEYFLWKIDEATQAGKVEETLGGHVGSWSLGVDYFRLDGSSSCENRSLWCKNFNREDNPRARLFLISTRAGGLGINLVAANRVVIFDVSWNPSHDVQSIFRVYRFGQKKPCYIYRFLAMGTMEEKIYERQVTKQAISKRVIDEQQIDRHYTETDLAELYTFQPKPTEPRPVPLLPKDRLFAEMLKEHEALIYRYHEHDSLLENKEEETLTEEERKAAWEDFENEKNRPPPSPFVPQGYMPHMNGMNNMMQQQLMIATMVNTLRKDYPNFSEQQIGNLLSTMFYADPSKLRGMSALGQAGMMGPMGVGVGPTSSGYAPTWQQQQQMQYQRLQAQQAALSSAPGVKYYSGGLGSRDPVSMALQQKQQREMMLSSTQDRLRDMLVGPGARAPLNPAEVVNLDDSE